MRGNSISIQIKKYLHAYLKEKPLFFSFVRPKEASLYQQYKPFKRPVLDLGCGDGFFAQVAFEKVDVGIDIDKKALEEAKRKNVYKQIKYYDGRKIPYPNEYFSTVVCNSTFEHITNLDEVLKECSRVMKKGGMFYFTTVTDIWHQYLFGTIFGGKLYKMFFSRISKHYNLYSFEKWQRKLKKIHFSITYHTCYLDNKKMFWLFDISHYLSAHSLLSKKMFNRWVLFPEKVKFLAPIEEFIIRHTMENTEKGPCLFVAAQKI